MIKDLIDFFAGKKIIILGFGREGQSTYRLIRRYLKEQVLYIADQKENLLEESNLLKNDKNIVYIGGKDYLQHLENYDIIMKSPGISFVGINTEKFINKISSQMELLLKFFKIKTIGVTGTKGKSTTSSLIYKVLKEQNIKTELLGNIGVPIFDYIDKIEENMILVLEMSSHQLEYCHNSPYISIVLNIFPEHLDHYDSYEKYIEAKCNIFKYQNEKNYLLYNNDNNILREHTKECKAQKYKISIKDDLNSDIYLKEEKVYFQNKLLYDANEPRNLLGRYNLNNIMFVLGVSEILGLDINQTIKSISEFKSLEHRLEYVGKFDNILYYDNSIATVPVATIEAIEALKEVDTLIIGGMDRGIDYSEFIIYLNKSCVNNIICMPKTGHDIAKKFKKEKVHVVETLEEAVKVAKEVTKKEKICLLSPSAASYGFFKNFEEKGNKFKELVKIH